MKCDTNQEDRQTQKTGKARGRQSWQFTQKGGARTAAVILIHVTALGRRLFREAHMGIISWIILGLIAGFIGSRDWPEHLQHDRRYCRRRRRPLDLQHRSTPTH
jgi:hypothetical protein